MPDLYEIAALIERRAIGLGFSACGFSPSTPLIELEPHFRNWLSMGNAGEMNYLARNINVRLDPAKLVEGAKTVISLAAAYYSELPGHIPGNPRISRYALSTDYHGILKSRGHELLQWIQTEFGPVRGRVFTDSAPIPEREWGKRAGIGWIGKNGCLIIPRLGSWFFLAEIVLDIEILSGKRVVENHCGNCNRCIEACPTGALNGDGSMNPRKCISYLTIEQKSQIPDEFKGKWQDWIFGCDICQDACPWNKYPEKCTISELLPRSPLYEMDAEFFRNLNSLSFVKLFDGTPVLRAGWSGILRNFVFLEREESE